MGNDTLSGRPDEQGLVHARRKELRRWAEIIEAEAPEVIDELVARRADQAPSLTVGQLALELGYSSSRTYRLLERRGIPGAFKPFDAPNSRWFIPADAAIRFRRRGERAAA